MSKEIKTILFILDIFLSLFISMIGYRIHHSVLWSIFDFIFSICVLCKWLIYHEITLTIIKETFSFFFA